MGRPAAAGPPGPARLRVQLAARGTTPTISGDAFDLQEGHVDGNDSAGRAILSRAAIVGLGITETGKVYGRSARDFAAEAVRLAVADAGLALDDVDGLLLSNGISGGVDFPLQKDLGLRNLRLMNQISAAGATAISQVQYAAMAIATGIATTVVCVHADAPLQKPGVSSGAIYRGAADRREPKGFGALALAGGRARGQQRLRPGGATPHGPVRHDERAARCDRGRPTPVGEHEPRARFRDPITIDDHQASRWVAEPLHLLDCCMVSNGGIAILVTSAERAGDLRQPPVHLWGAAQTHPGYTMASGCEFGLVTGAAISGPAAMEMAGIKPGDVNVCEIYDCYTYTALVTLEDYGFCAKGRGRCVRCHRGAGTGRFAPYQYRWRAAVQLLPVGHDPAVRGGHPGPGPGRRPPGPDPRRRARQRQRRHPRLPRHPGARGRTTVMSGFTVNATTPRRRSMTPPPSPGC